MSEKMYLFAPQWQDSGGTNELYTGALALKRYFETICGTSVIDAKIEECQIPEVRNSIFGFDILEKQLSTINDILSSTRPNQIGVIGGGCGIEVPLVSYFASGYSDLQVIWFDAHGDLNSPESSPSKHFHGMPLRFIVEKQVNSIGLKYSTIDASSICLVGTRDLDPPEVEFINENDIKVVSVSPSIGSHLQAALKQGVPTYIHIDLDVIDPSEYKNVKCPVAKGLTIKELVSSIDYIIGTTHVVGISIVENVETELVKIDSLRAVFDRFISF